MVWRGQYGSKTVKNRIFPNRAKNGPRFRKIDFSASGGSETVWNRPHTPPKPLKLGLQSPKIGSKCSKIDISRSFWGQNAQNRVNLAHWPSRCGFPTSKTQKNPHSGLFSTFYVQKLPKQGKMGVDMGQNGRKWSKIEFAVAYGVIPKNRNVWPSWAGL